MRTTIVLLLLCFWIFLAFRAFSRGDVALAAVYALVGVGLTAYRLSR